MVTMPLTLMEILAKYWPLGNNVSLCKTIGTLQATSIFVSTISITSIALDRYQVFLQFKNPIHFKIIFFSLLVVIYEFIVHFFNNI